MKWMIPAKTFLLGEYAALAEASAFIITTTPSFELTLIDSEELIHIHPKSPAGLWWIKNKSSDTGISWNDPYKGTGGLGASSAQFLGSYLATSWLRQQAPDLDTMLLAYYDSAWNGTGLKPSGYDVIAQSQSGCVYINKSKKIIQSYDWPFQDLSFILLHTQKKLATHEHLQSATLPQSIEPLTCIVEQAKRAFDTADSASFIDAIKQYHQHLHKLKLVAEHSINHINTLKTYPEVLAVKGCGAMGADVLLVITTQRNKKNLLEKLRQAGWMILGTEKNCSNQSLLSNPWN